MRDLFVAGAMPDFWPPRPSRFWQAMLAPFYRRYVRRNYCIAEVVAEGAADLWQHFGPADSVLIAPNHSAHSDPHIVMELGRQLRKQFYFMAAWQLFALNAGLSGWILQRYGAFSVDREGADRQALNQAIELLSTGRPLVVFPEGEVYHLNDRLTPFLEGVAFMALTAQRELDKKPDGARVWILPTFIRYHYLEDVQARLEEAMTRLEERVLLKPSLAPLQERIVRFGEIVLTIKEKEKLGRSGEGEGDLPMRRARLMNTLLERLETAHLKRAPSAETVPLRVKALRRCLLEAWTDENNAANGTRSVAATESAPQDMRRPISDALDDLHLVVQLFSYLGDYLGKQPTVERLAETIEKFEEDIHGGQIPPPKAPRRARLFFGRPIDLKERMGSGRIRTLATEVTADLEQAIQELMAANP
jgi:1-acyl-sn-glycerol-3-phosphate acyltransferase